MAKQKYDYDLIVIGSGAGGSAAATIAARSGKRVAIIEYDTFGGDSPNWGDVPLKAFLHAAHLYDEAKIGAKFGLRSSTISYNYPSLRAWKDLAVKRTGAGGNRKYYENEGIDAYSARAHFISPHEVAINQRRHLSAEYFLIATGSNWKVPDIQGLPELEYLTPRTILEVPRPPKSLYIIGGGSTGVEIAQLLSIFGTKVYIAEASARLLPEYDSEAGETIANILTDEKGVVVLPQTRTLSVEKENIAKRVIYSRVGTEHSLRVDDVMIATGRDPEVDIGLENAGVAYTAKGIEVNENLQTSASHIYAAGDVLGGYGLTHTAILESRVAAHNILNRKKTVPDYTATPRLVFTHPGVASVGLSEDDCLRRDLSVKTASAPLNIIARGNTSDFSRGFVKLICDQKSNVLLGATVVSPAASEMIHELALALKHKMTAADVAMTPHAFLSWSEAIRVAAAKLS